MDWLWLLLLGLGTGTFGVLVGTGGGVVLVPMLLLFFNIEPAVVAGSSLALVAVNSFSGSVVYLKRRVVDRRSGLMFAAAALPGSVLAPFAVKAVAGDTFRALFAVLLLAIAFYMLYRSMWPLRPGVPPAHLVTTAVRGRSMTVGGETFEYEFNEALAAGFNFVLGFISAFFGTGGGFLRTPVLVAAFGFPIQVAVATSIFALSIYATAGAGVHALLGHIEWYPTFVSAGAGLLVGSQIGVWLAPKVRSQWTVQMLIALLLVMGVRLLVQAVRG